MRKTTRAQLAWSEEEIVRSYRDAANPEKQIGILADLNDCDPSVIRAVLRGAGIGKKKKKKAAGGAMLSARMEQGFAWGHRIALINGGVNYTVEEVGRIHGKSKSSMSRYMHGKDVCCIGGVQYQILRYHAKG